MTGMHSYHWQNIYNQDVYADRLRLVIERDRFFNIRM